MPSQPRVGCHIDDARADLAVIAGVLTRIVVGHASMGKQMGERSLRQPEHAAQVDGDHLVPHFFGDLCGVLSPADASDIAEHAEVAEGGIGVCYQLVAGGSAGDVVSAGVDGAASRTAQRCRLSDPVGVDVCCENRRSF